MNDKVIAEWNNYFTIIAEEGLLHNFSSEIETFIKNNNQNLGNFQHRAIIHCYAQPEQVAKQILKRYNEGGRLLPQHKNLSLEELTANQRTALENKMNFAETIEKVGVPVLYINTSDNLQQNAQKINSFIEQLTK